MMFKEAIAELSKAVTLQRNMTVALAALGHASAVSGQKSQALHMLNQLKQMSKERYVSPPDIALIYAGLGEKDQALTWLERGFSERSWYMVLLKVDPRLAPYTPTRASKTWCDASASRRKLALDTRMWFRQQAIPWL
jgi:hypothetical protein